MPCSPTLSLCTSCRYECCAFGTCLFATTWLLFYCAMLSRAHLKLRHTNVFLQFAVSQSEKGILLKLPMHEPVIIAERPEWQCSNCSEPVGQAQRFTTTRRNLLASSAFSNFLAAVSSSIRKSVEPLECFFFRSLPSLLRCQANGWLQCLRNGACAQGRRDQDVPSLFVVLQAYGVELNMHEANQLQIKHRKGSNQHTQEMIVAVPW